MQNARVGHDDSIRTQRRRCKRGMPWHLFWLVALFIPKVVRAVYSDGSFGYVAETNVSLLYVPLPGIDGNRVRARH